MVEKKLGGAGLRGQSAGETALCTVGKEGSGLTYRGYTIEELAAKAEFEREHAARETLQYTGHALADREGQPSAFRSCFERCPLRKREPWARRGLWRPRAQPGHRSSRRLPKLRHDV